MKSLKSLSLSYSSIQIRISFSCSTRISGALIIFNLLYCLVGKPKEYYHHRNCNESNEITFILITILSLSLPFTCTLIVKTFKNENIHRLKWLFSWRNCSKLHLKPFFPPFFFLLQEKQVSRLAQWSSCKNYCPRFWTLDSVEIHMTRLCVCCLKRFTILGIEQMTTTEHQEASTRQLVCSFWSLTPRESEFPLFQSERLNIPVSSHSQLIWQSFDLPEGHNLLVENLLGCSGEVYQPLDPTSQMLPGRGWWQDWWCLCSSFMPGAQGVQREGRGEPSSPLTKGNLGHCHSRGTHPQTAGVGKYGG